MMGLINKLLYCFIIGTFSCPEGEKVKLKHGNTEGFSYREMCYEFNWTRPDNLTQKALLGKW